MQKVDHYTDQELIEQLKEDRMEPDEIPQARWTESFTRMFLGKVFVKQIPGGMISEAMELKLRKNHPRFLSRLESPSEALCVLEVLDNPSLLSQIPKRFRKKELCEKATQQALDHYRKLKGKQKTRYKSEFSLGSIPKCYRTLDLCEKCLEINGKSLRFVPDSLLTDELILKAVLDHPFSLKYVPDHRLSEELILKATQRSGRVLEFVPTDLLTTNVVESAIKKTPTAIKWIENPSESLCLMAVSKNADALMSIRNPSLPVILAAIEKNPSLIAKFPDLQTPKLIRECGKRISEENPWSLDFFLIRLNDNKLTKGVMEDFSLLTAWSTEKKWDDFDSSQTLEQMIYLQNLLGDDRKNGSVYASHIESLVKRLNLTAKEGKQLMEQLGEDRSFDFLPHVSVEGVRTILPILQQDGLKLRSVKPYAQTTRLVQAAINENGLALKYVAPSLKTQRLCRLAIAKNPKAKAYSPFHLGL